MLKIVRDDISRMHADAIVNCASSEPTFGPGVESAIYAKGGRWLREARAAIGVIEHGHAAITKGTGKLNCKWVIHAVGPYWEGGERGEIALLCNCYREVLSLALQRKCRTLAIPLISAGNHGFPNDIALSAAIGEISRFLLAFDMDIRLVVYDWDSYLKSGRIFGDIESYLGEDFDTDEAIINSYWDAIAPQKRNRGPKPFKREPHDKEFSAEERERSLAKAQQKNSEIGVPHRYAGKLTSLMATHHRTAPQVYGGGNLSKQVFAKVLNGKYASHPDKDTMLQLAIGLRLDLNETREFLSYAEAALSPALLRDVIISDFIVRGDYNSQVLDFALDKAGCDILCDTFDQKPKKRR